MKASEKLTALVNEALPWKQKLTPEEVGAVRKLIKDYSYTKTEVDNLQGK